MGARVDATGHLLGRWLPLPLLRALLSRAVGTRRLCLCLHRVGPPRPGEALPQMRITAPELDSLLEQLQRVCGDRPLTVSFDDGYTDAADYVASRAARFPRMEWLFFVCPRKVRTREGFGWDAGESGRATDALADRGPFQMVTRADCLRLAALPNVTLGNHSNGHLKATATPLVEVERDYREAAAEFGALFGPARHFAFPFGTPQVEFGPQHVALARDCGQGTLWSTEPRPYAAEERGPGAVIPRFPIDGRHTPRELLGWMAVRSLLFRLRGPRARYPLATQPEPQQSRAA